MQDALARLVDRAAIHDLLSRYCRGVDRKDWPAVRACFHPDAYDDHAEYKGNVDGFIAWVTRRHQHVPQSMHFLGNCLIEFASSDLAAVETYFLALQRLGADAGPALSMIDGGGKGAVDVTVVGRYIDRMERRQGEWRIARRTVTFDVIRTAPAAGPELKPDWAQTTRDGNDPVFANRRAVGLG
ncbi:MAG: nuclear transport factor 2 family protein [Alphaproteobacteria bacterium]|nr:nuclear transport factor 2 family protein [Alphaproteobacteria bacterium]